MWNEDNKEGNHWQLLEIKVEGIRRKECTWIGIGFRVCDGSVIELKKLPEVENGLHDD
jgi:hypothetical protein